jgi:hypothetical protein
MGLILGTVPLGYGLLLPEQTIYKMPEDKKNPTVIKVMVQKIKGIISRLTLSAWAFTNYHKPEEMTDYHKSMKTSQYDILQTQRTIIENWVARQIPPEEANPVCIRQYQNAVLQAVAWRAKRHKWGYGGWKAMDDATFKEWWKQYWKGQGLNEATLESLYTRMEVWLKRLQEEKVSLGEKVKTTRQRLALLL